MPKTPPAKPPAAAAIRIGFGTGAASADRQDAAGSPDAMGAAPGKNRGWRAPGGSGPTVSLDGQEMEVGTAATATLATSLLATPTLATPFLAILGSIETMRATVAMARALVEGGRAIDLAGLEHEAAAICQALEDMPAPSARAMRPAMLALMREVEALAVMMPAR